MKKLTIVIFLLVFVTFAFFAQAQGPPPKDVNATVVNTPLPVEVVNGTSTPLEAFQFTESLTNQTGTVATSWFAVPPGKRLVIETITMRASLPVTQGFWAFTIETRLTDEAGVSHYIPIFKQTETDLVAYFSACEQVRLYADPETTVFMKIHRPEDSGAFLFAPTISGYLVPYESSG